MEKFREQGNAKIGVATRTLAREYERETKRRFEEAKNDSEISFEEKRTDEGKREKDKCERKVRGRPCRLHRD